MTEPTDAMLTGWAIENDHRDDPDDFDRDPPADPVLPLARPGQVVHRSVNTCPIDFGPECVHHRRPLDALDVAANDARLAREPEPMTADDEWISYPGFGGAITQRRLLAWRISTYRVLALVIEGYDDPGTSVTNAPGAVLDAVGRHLGARWEITTVEWYPPARWPVAPVPVEFSVILPTGRDGHRWRAVDSADVSRLLPRLSSVTLR